MILRFLLLLFTLDIVLEGKRYATNHSSDFCLILNCALA